MLLALEQLLFEIRHARTDQRLVNRDAFRRRRKRNGRVRTGIGEPLFGRRMNALSSLGDRPPVGVEILNPLECDLGCHVTKTEISREGAVNGGDDGQFPAW